MRVNISLAAWPGLRHAEAAAIAIGMSRAGALAEPGLGPITCEHVQLVPQSFGVLTEELAAELRDRYPGGNLRLHANVRVLERHRFADLSGFDLHTEWFAQAARISRTLGATAYTAHAGRRTEATLPEVFDNTRRCAELFGVPVGVEGHYPTPGNEFNLATWEEYRALLDSGVAYALDLSHLNIVAHRTGKLDTGLTAELLASENAIEIHLSGNDGRGDQHRIVEAPCWWHALLENRNPAAIIFTEGNHRRAEASTH